MAEPMYRMIADDLRRKIESGELPKDPGGPLPTELELREQYGASRNTVRDSIKWLTNLGLVETRPGQGTFVVEKPTPVVATLTGDADAAQEEAVHLTEGAASGRMSTGGAPKVEIHRADEVLARAGLRQAHADGKRMRQAASLDSKKT